MIEETIEVRLARIEEKMMASAVAVEIAKHEVNHRLENMNFLRDQVNSERGAYMLRSEYEAKSEILSNAIHDLQKFQYMTMGGLVVFQVLVALVMRFTGR